MVPFLWVKGRGKPSFVGPVPETVPGWNRSEAAQKATVVLPRPFAQNSVKSSEGSG